MGRPPRCTVTSSPLTTWWLVRTYPEGETTNPLPVASSTSSRSTTSFHAPCSSARTVPNTRMKTVASEGLAAPAVRATPAKISAIASGRAVTTAM
jgi:hypothetical protein